MKFKVGLLFTLLFAANVNSSFAWKPWKKNKDISEYKISEDRLKEFAEWRKNFLKNDLNKLKYLSTVYVRSPLSIVPKAKVVVPFKGIIKYAVIGNLKELKRYLKKNEDGSYRHINIQISPSSWTPLMYAIRAGQPEIAEFLIENGAVIDIDAYGTTAVTLARDFLPEIYEKHFSKSNGFDANKFIPEDGVDYGSVNKNSLYNAVLDGYFQKIGYLVDVVGVDIEVGYNGITPLARAALDGKKDIVIYLLRHNANPFVKVKVLDTMKGTSKLIDLSDAVTDGEIKSLLLSPGYANDEKYLSGSSD